MNYELMVIAHPKEDPSSIVTKLEKFIKGAQAQGVKIEKMGKKTLAYPIAKQQEGEFFLFNFEAPGEAIGKITQNLRLEQETILRYLLTKRKESKIEIKRQRTSESKRQEDIEGQKETKAKVTVTTKPLIKTATKVTPHFAKASRGQQVSKGTKVSKVSKGTEAKEKGKVIVKAVAKSATKVTKAKKTKVKEEKKVAKGKELTTDN